MTRAVVVVRPEPGGTRTATALRSLGVQVRQIAVFAVVPVDWIAPDPGKFDALLLTSANAVRHGGGGLDLMKPLPVVAVGATTAAAATQAGFAVAVTGADDARAVIAEAHARGFVRLLHLAGRDRAPTDRTEGRVDGGIETVTVYASDTVPLGGDARGNESNGDASSGDASLAATVTRAFEDAIVLVHSARAAARVAQLVAETRADQARIEIVAISRAAGDAAGDGWAAVSIAAEPSDSALVALAVERARLTIRRAAGISTP